MNAKILNSYIGTALWSSIGDNEEPLDSKFGIEDLSTEALGRAKNDVTIFLEKAGALLDGYDLETAAHDFWLTRNGHGAGFWDGDYEESIGRNLTELSKTFGEINLYVGDDGKLYFDRGE